MVESIRAYLRNVTNKSKTMIKGKWPHSKMCKNVMEGQGPIFKKEMEKRNDG